jgi:hypothetical protein
MTAPNAFQQAAAQAAQPAPAYATPAVPAGQIADTNGNLTTSFAGQGSQLFGGPVLPPSLLNKTHTLGTVRSGRIVTAPYDVHSRDFKSKQPKYWAITPGPRGEKISFSPVDAVTGEQLRKVLDTVIELATDYRFDAAEAAAVERDPNMPDDGSRAFYVSGEDLKALRKQIQLLGLRDEKEMIGLTLTVKRVGQKPNPGGYPSWINEVTLSR